MVFEAVWSPFPIRIAYLVRTPEGFVVGDLWGTGTHPFTVDGHAAPVAPAWRWDSKALAYVTVEPGVTFAALHAFLRARGSRLFASTTGGSPHASVVGNALERGDGSGPYGDRLQHACALEVVLPTGEVVHTGHDRFEGARSALPFSWHAL